jgi:tetrahydromethanopterin S-methyltransferase subunit H
VFIFKKEQQAYDFGGVTIGGHPGEHPTTLIGGLFFKGQSIVEDTREGRFDKKEAKSWIDDGVTMSEKTGHPLIVEAYGRTGEAMRSHISWLADNWDGPFMFESVTAAGRVAGMEYTAEVGLQERAVFNSITLAMKDEEKAALRASKLDKGVVLGWSSGATSLTERMDTIMESLTLAGELGTEKVLVDPATMPVGAGYGLEFRTTLAIKSELGLPTLLAPHNAPSAWGFLRDLELSEESGRSASVIAATVSAQLFATDAIMYGSMARTKEIFTAVSLTANAIYSAMNEANRAIGVERPMFSPKSFPWGR